MIAFDVPFPRDPVMFGLVLLLAAAAMFSIGLLIGALAPTVSSGQDRDGRVLPDAAVRRGVLPRETMPDGLRAVSDLSPAGAAVQAMKDAWFGATPDAGSLLVMAVIAVGAGLLAVRFLRWD